MAGNDRGHIKTLVIHGNKWHNTASWVGSSNGNVETLMIKDNKGYWAAYWAGWDGGNIGTLAFYKAGRNAGYKAKAKRIIKGREALKLYKKLEKKLHL